MGVAFPPDLAKELCARAHAEGGNENYGTGGCPDDSFQHEQKGMAGLRATLSYETAERPVEGGGRGYWFINLNLKPEGRWWWSPARFSLTICEPFLHIAHDVGRIQDLLDVIFVEAQAPLLVLAHLGLYSWDLPPPRFAKIPSL